MTCLRRLDALQKRIVFHIGNSVRFAEAVGAAFELQDAIQRHSAKSGHDPALELRSL